MADQYAVRMSKAKLGNPLIRQIVLPAAALDPQIQSNAVAFTYGNWTDIALAATVALESIVVGVCFTNPSAGAEYTIDIGSCDVLGTNYANAAAVIAAGAAVIAAAHRAEVRCSWTDITDAAWRLHYVIPLDYPVHIPIGVGIIARMYDSAGNGTGRVSVLVVQGF